MYDLKISYPQRVKARDGTTNVLEKEISEEEVLSILEDEGFPEHVREGFRHLISDDYFAIATFVVEEATVRVGASDMDYFL